MSLWSPLPVLRERVRVRVISNVERFFTLKITLSPRPSPGVPGEGVIQSEVARSGLFIHSLSRLLKTGLLTLTLSSDAKGSSAMTTSSEVLAAAESTDPLPEAVLESGAAPLPPRSSGRLVSLDALRGLNMFWIVGFDELIPRLSKFSWGQADTPVGRAMRMLATQFDHAA